MATVEFSSVHTMEVLDATFMQYLAALAVAVVSAVTAAMATLKVHKVRNGAITKSDLLQAEARIEANAKRDRHEMYGEIHKLGAALEIDIQRVEDNISEYVKSNELRVRMVEIEQARRGGGKGRS